MNDISEYYIGNKAVEEDVQWILTRQYQRKLEFVLPKIKQYGIKSIIEWGCGSGLVAAEIPEDVEYLGIDKNPIFIKLAIKHTEGKGNLPEFFQDDIRTFLHGPTRDLSMAWTFLKHFSLQEQDAIFAKLLSAGHYAAFNVQILARDLDNGKDYHHTFITEARLHGILEKNGHKELHRDVFSTGELPEGIMQEIALWTQRLNA